MKARKKPVEIDYFPNDVVDIYEKRDQLIKFVEGFGDNFPDHFMFSKEGFKVFTKEGTSYEVTDLDVVIRGIQGEYYPCKKDIFEATYDKID